MEPVLQPLKNSTINLNFAAAAIALNFLTMQSAIADITYTVDRGTDSSVNLGGAGSGTTGDFRYVLNQILNQQAQASMPNSYQVLFDGVGSVVLTAPAPPLNLFQPDTITIGNPSGSVTLDGGGAYRLLFIRQGTLTLQNLTIQNGKAQGGNGGLGAGGGMGAGGALFIDQATVMIDNVNFAANTASSGRGGAVDGFGGGGGLGGNGGNGGGGADGSGGAGGLYGDGGDNNGGSGGACGNGGNGNSDFYSGGGGGAIIGANGGSAAFPTGDPGTSVSGYVFGGGGGQGDQAGGAGGGIGGSPGQGVMGGGGGYNAPTNVDGGKGGGGGGGSGAGSGGVGGDGGGGGNLGGYGGGPGGFGAGTSYLSLRNAGFGGGGSRGAAGNALAPGFGGGGPNGVAGGVGGSAGSSANRAGDGAAFGGAVFMNSGGSITFTGDSAFSSNGTTANSGAGCARGSDFFIVSNANVHFNPASGKTITLQGTVADDSVQSVPAGETWTPGTGSGASISINGAGTLALSGSNTYSGGTNLIQGTLSINNSNALGSGTLTVSGSGTLVPAAAGINLPVPIAIQMGDVLDIDTSASGMTLSGTVSGSGSLRTGSNSVVLTGSLSNFSGDILIGAGGITVNPISYPTSDISPQSGTADLYLGVAPRSLSYSGQLSGNMNVTKTGPGILELLGSSHNIGSGDLTISEGSFFLHGGFQSTGTISVSSSTYLTFDDHASTGSILNHGTTGVGLNQIVNVSGNIDSNGTLLVEVDAATTSDTGSFVATGTADVTGSTIRVYPLFFSGSISQGSYPFLRAGAISSDPSSVTVVSINPALTFFIQSSVQGGEDIWSLVFGSIVPVAALHGPFISDNAAAVANYLDSLNFLTRSSSEQAFSVDEVDFLASGTTGNMPSSLAAFYAALVQASSSDQVNNVLNQLHTGPYKGLSFSQENNTKTVMEVLNSRMLEYGLNVCSSRCLLHKNEFCQKPSPTIWADYIVDGFSQGSTDGNPGFHTFTNGCVIGAEGSIGSGCAASLGGSAGYTYSNIDWNRSWGRMGIHSVYLAIYEKMDWDRVFLQMAILGEGSWYSGHRNIDVYLQEFDQSVVSFNTQAKNTHHSFGIDGMVSAGYKIDLKKDRFIPYLSADYFYMNESSFKEKGADYLNLDVLSSNYDRLRIESGVYFSRWRYAVIPEFQCSLIYEKRFFGKTYIESFVGEEGSMKIFGVRPSTVWKVSPGAGLVVFFLNQRLQLSLRYKGEFGLRNSFYDNTGNCELTYKF